MKRLSGFAALYFSGLALLVFLAVHFALGSYFAKLIVDTLLLGVSVMIVLTWGSAAMRAFRRGAADDVAKVVLTIWLAWAALLIQRAWVILSAALNRPDWMIESPVGGLIATTILIAGAYALIAPATGDDVPKREIINTIVAVAVGALVTGIAIGVMWARGWSLS